MSAGCWLLGFVCSHLFAVPACASLSLFPASCLPGSRSAKLTYALICDSLRACRRVFLGGGMFPNCRLCSRSPLPVLIPLGNVLSAFVRVFAHTARCTAGLCSLQSADVVNFGVTPLPPFAFPPFAVSAFNQSSFHMLYDSALVNRFQIRPRRCPSDLMSCLCVLHTARLCGDAAAARPRLPGARQQHPVLHSGMCA